ncbi:hypothetical protein MRX96_013383 [Rhipicephalus microplus]
MSFHITVAALQCLCWTGSSHVVVAASEGAACALVSETIFYRRLCCPTAAGSRYRDGAHMSLLRALVQVIREAIVVQRLYPRRPVGRVVEVQQRRIQQAHHELQKRWRFPLW